MALISRDPFAREELHRKRETVVSAACNWCGSVRKTPKGNYFLYRYSIETDGGTKAADKHLFCSVSCRRDYYD